MKINKSVNIIYKKNKKFHFYIVLYYYTIMAYRFMSSFIFVHHDYIQENKWDGTAEHNLASLLNTFQVSMFINHKNVLSCNSSIFPFVLSKQVSPYKSQHMHRSHQILKKPFQSFSHFFLHQIYCIQLHYNTHCRILYEICCQIS